MSDSNLA